MSRLGLLIQATTIALVLGVSLFAFNNRVEAEVKYQSRDDYKRCVDEQQKLMSGLAGARLSSEEKKAKILNECGEDPAKVTPTPVTPSPTPTQPADYKKCLTDSAYRDKHKKACAAEENKYTYKVHASIMAVQKTWDSKDSNQIVIDKLGTQVAGENSDCYAYRAGETDIKTYFWEKYLGSAGNLVPSTNGWRIAGNGDSSLISSVITTSLDTNNWEMMSVSHHERGKTPFGDVKVYYHVSDDPTPLTKADDPNWIGLADPTTSDPGCGTDGFQKALYNLNVEHKKYFQYRIQLLDDDREAEVTAVSILLQPVDRKLKPSPSPSPSPTPTPTDEGRLMVQTVKMVVASPKPTPTTGTGGNSAPLPNLTPTPTPQSAQQKKDEKQAKQKKFCQGKISVDPADNVGFDLKQLTGGEARIKDQVTDADGEWNGIIDDIHELKMGTYEIRFGEYQPKDYKLVALCVTPDSSDYYVKTKLDIRRSTAVIKIRGKGKATTITALYAPRTKPYVALSKFAVDQSNKLMQKVFLGQSLRYIIRYENTGDSDAYDLVIQDIIPEQFYVPENVVAQNRDLKYGLDILKRVTITKKIPLLKKGEKGSITIPVTFRPDAFGSPTDIQKMIDADKQASTATTPPAASPVSSPAATTGP